MFQTQDSTFAVPSKSEKGGFEASVGSALREERAHDSLVLSWQLPAQPSPCLGKRHRSSLIGNGRDERLHHLAERLPLGKRGRDTGRQGPEGLRLRVALTRASRALKLSLELTLKGVE